MLTSKQRAQLRALANTEETIFQIGKGGIGENLITQINDALEARELIKIRVLENSGETAKSVGNEIAKMCEAELVQVVGTRFVLYKQSKNKKVIVLVK